MSDPALRRAVAVAIDREAISAAVRGGADPITGSAVPASAWFHADQSPVRFDPAKARSILDAAGWQPGPDGIRRKAGLTARVEVCTTTEPLREDTVGRIRAWLEDVGIEVIPNAVTPEEMFADEGTATDQTPCALSRSTFDLAEQALTGPLDPLATFFAYHSSQVSPNGANEASVNDPRLDAVLETVRQSVDLGLVDQAMAEFQKVYVEEVVEIPLYFGRQVELVQPRLVNFVANPGLAGSTWNTADWSIK